jgi:phosphonate transport system substrate-binding protein
MNRRHILLATSFLMMTSSMSVNAQDWKAKYPELTFAIIPAENATGVVERYSPLMDYLTKQIGVKVNLRIANDYAAVIEGQRTGSVHIASYGSASFARALITGVKTEAFGIDVNGDGTTGYYSVFYVKKDSPYKSIEDLKGKNLGLVDPNSTSGNNVPRLVLDQKGINPETYFGKVVFTGSHDNAVLALAQGTVDVAANAWTTDEDNYAVRLATKGLLKAADGTAIQYSDLRIVARSEPILNGPLTYLSDLPADLKAKIADAFFNLRKNDKAVADKLYDGKMDREGWKPAKTEEWKPVVDLVKFVDSLAKKKS